MHFPGSEPSLRVAGLRTAVGITERPDLTFPFSPGQPPVVQSSSHASQVVAVQSLVSGPGRSASPTMASMFVEGLSCQINGWYQLLTASPGTNSVEGQSEGQKWAGNRGWMTPA